ncbi:hypothetical protein Pint_01552 [Pistacia integerrima]|uniref:Uncharacterized protein n=1 Tax=Pistacia integerrima TaxID=434235 RepID=A0ACC0ZRH9_9ROSI|nr:hypothetical protein Pint_01552 [Pistacia integerrima]
MAFRTTRSWTFWGLVGAFIDLGLAYFLLCGSAFAFFASKFCNLFGLDLLCPCTGFFGYQNSNICLHRLLIDWPVRKIFYVQMLIKSKFPFDLIWFEDQPCNLEMMWSTDRNYDNGVLELENEASSSSFSSPKLQNLVDRESGFDAKGKKIVNQRQKHGIRRRRRSSLGYGKSSARVVVAGSSDAPYNGSDIRSQIGDCSSPIYGKEHVLQDDGNAAIGLDLGERTWHNFEQGVSFGNNKVKDNDSSTVEKFICTAQGKSKNAGNEENMIRILKEALEEEKAACTALQLELEKERAAAATAADEAMAMILRLQADKASIEMEARQYQRMIEEKCEYEEEEMNIMKDILVRRERENHFLEKEVEAYRQMRSLGNGQSEVDFSHLTSEWGQRPLHSLDSNEDLLEFEKGKSFDKNKVEKAANWSSNYEASSAEMTSEAAQICQKKILSCCGQKLEKVEEDGTEVCGNLQCPKLDAEPIVYDVHVIDDKTELQMEENGKEDRTIELCGY